MKKLLILIAFFPSLLYAQLRINMNSQIRQVSTEIDTGLRKNESKYTFTFNVEDDQKSAVDLIYSIDGENHTERNFLDSLSIKTTPGKHIFQFYYNENYYEVYSDSLLIEGRNHDTYEVQLFSAIQREEAAKPVIYLYPKQKTEINVKIDIHGEDTFLYPTYIDSWNFVAEPNGDLHFAEKTYNYLFWESTTRTIISREQRTNGFFVEGKNAVHFLEEKLTKAGLNSKEQADFITFWGPRLAKNKLNFVHFEFNETCEKYAELDISPKPDNLYRIFMVWGAVSEEFEVKEQTIEKFDRSGFSVLEWGGQESTINKPFDTL